MFGTVRWIRLPCPKEPFCTARSSASGSTPAFTPSVSASPTITRALIVIRLCTSFAIAPAPEDPM